MKVLAIGGRWHGFSTELPDEMIEWGFADEDGVSLYQRRPEWDFITEPDEAAAFASPDVVLRSVEVRYQPSTIPIPHSEQTLADEAIMAQVAQEVLRFSPLTRGVWYHGTSLVTGECTVRFSWLAFHAEGPPEAPEGFPAASDGAAGIDGPPGP